MTSPTPGRRKLVCAGWIVTWYTVPTGLMRRLFLVKKNALQEKKQVEASLFASRISMFKVYRERVGGRGK